MVGLKNWLKSSRILQFLSKLVLQNNLIAHYCFFKQTTEMSICHCLSVKKRVSVKNVKILEMSDFGNTACDWTMGVPHVFAGCNPFWRVTKIGPFFGITRIEQIKPILPCFLCCSFASALRCREGKYSDDLLTVGEHAIKGQNQIEHRVEVPYKANYEQYVNTEISFEKQVRGVRRALPT